MYSATNPFAEAASEAGGSVAAPRRNPSRRSALAPPVCLHRLDHLYQDRARRRLSRRREAVVSQMAPYGAGDVQRLVAYHEAFKLGVRSSSSEDQVLNRDSFLKVLRESGFGKFLHDGAESVVGERLFDVFSDGAGEVDFRSFCSGMACLMDGSVSEKMRFGFRLYDVEGKGTIAIEEMRAMLEAISVSMYVEDGMDQDARADVERLLEHIKAVAVREGVPDGRLTIESFLKLGEADEEIRSMWALSVGDVSK